MAAPGRRRDGPKAFVGLGVMDLTPRIWCYRCHAQNTQAADATRHYRDSHPTVRFHDEQYWCFENFPNSRHGNTPAAVLAATRAEQVIASSNGGPPPTAAPVGPVGANTTPYPYAIRTSTIPTGSRSARGVRAYLAGQQALRTIFHAAPLMIVVQTSPLAVAAQTVPFAAAVQAASAVIQQRGTENAATSPTAHENYEDTQLLTVARCMAEAKSERQKAAGYLVYNRKAGISVKDQLFWRDLKRNTLRSARIWEERARSFKEEETREHKVRSETGDFIN